MQAPSLPFHPLIALKLAPSSATPCNACGRRPTAWDLKVSSERGVLIVHERYCTQHSRQAEEKYLRLYKGLGAEGTGVGVAGRSKSGRGA